MPKKSVQVGEHCVVVGGKYGGRQGIVTKFTPMKARVQFDGEEASHIVDQSFLRSGFASSPGKVGDQVAIIKGKYVGCKGVIDSFTAQMVYVLLRDGSLPRVCQSSVVCIKQTVANPAKPLPTPPARYNPPLMVVSSEGKLHPVPKLSSSEKTMRTCANTHQATASVVASPRYRTVSPTPSCGEDDPAEDYYQKVRVGVNELQDVEVLFRVRSRENHLSSSSQMCPQRQVNHPPPPAIRISLEF